MTSAEKINSLAEEVHENNKKWWVDLETGQPVERNVGEMLMLCVSELAEAMEGHRKNLMDDKLPHRTMLEVEMADCLIRILDMSAGSELTWVGRFRRRWPTTLPARTTRARSALNQTGRNTEEDR